MAIECSNSAYERLHAAGILKKARLAKKDLQLIFLHRTVWEGKADKIIEEAKTAKQAGDSLTEEQQDILSLELKLQAEDFILRMVPFIVQHPFLVAKIVLGNDLDKFSQYGFNSKKNLAYAVTAYCIGEEKLINEYKRSYVWRRREYKNKVELIDHGDLSVIQTDVSENEDSGVLLEPPTSGFGREQDWSPFLYSILRYAQAIGKQNSPEIREWRDIIKELRTSNPWGNEYSKNLAETELHLKQLFTTDLFGTGNNTRVWINDNVLPCFREGALDFLRRSENGDLEITVYTKPEKYYVAAHYLSEDIPHLLKANYQLYARNVDDLAEIMHWFNKKCN